MHLQVKRTEILDIIRSMVPLVDCLGGLIRSSWW